MEDIFERTNVKCHVFTMSMQEEDTIEHTHAKFYVQSHLHNTTLDFPLTKCYSVNLPPYCDYDACYTTFLDPTCNILQTINVHKWWDP